MYQTFCQLAGVEITAHIQKTDGHFLRLIRAILSAACVLACSIVVTVPTGAQEFSFEHVTIDANPPDRPWYKMLGDIDGDGDPDIVVGGANGPLVWYANPSWTKAHIAGGGWDGVKGEMADLDGDGDTDIVMGGIVWFSNPRIGGGTWTKVEIDNQRAHDVAVGDLDLDGRLDVVARDQSAFGKAGNAIYVYRQATPRLWKKHEIACPHGEGLTLGDIDRDGDLDILIGAQWYENTGSATANGWREHVYTRAWTEPDAKVEMVDVNCDGRSDIVLTPAELRGQTYKIAWYEAPQDPKANDWQEHVIVPSIECVIHSLGAGDFDGDGDVDIAIAEMHQGTDPDELSVLLSIDNGAKWQTQVLSNRGSHDIVVADLDADGDLDILGANHSGIHPLEMWRNELIPGDADASLAAQRPPQQFTGLVEVNPPPDPDAETVQAIVGAILIDGRGGPPIEDSVIILRGNRVAVVAKREDAAIPTGAVVHDATGLTLMPGLIDSHFHIGADKKRMYDIPPLFLSHGVTAARDPGRPIEVYDPIRYAGGSAPRLFLTGPHFDQAPAAYPKNAVIIGDADHARRATREYASQGASAIKVYFRLPVEVIKATCETAADLRIPVTAHLELVDADLAIRAGVRGIEHVTSFGTVLAEPEVAKRFRIAVQADNAARRDGRYRLWASLDLDESPRVDALLKLIVERNVFISPTLATFERRGEDEDAQDYHVRGFENMMKFVGMFHRAGATVVTGSHTWSRHVDLGWAFQREMELLLESGLSPIEVIKASTVNNARFLGCADRLGTVEAGKLADFVLVEGNPLEDMRAMYEVRRVMLNGSWIETQGDKASDR